MRWLVGLDLRERSLGTVHMAAWLRSRDEAREVPCQHFVGVHVVDDSVRHSNRVMSEVVRDAEASLHRLAEVSGVDDPFVSLRVISAPTAEDAIADLVATEAYDGVIIGRIAPVDGHPVRRLGRVARRLARRLPAPVMIAPPHLGYADIGRGPILLATDLGPASVAAARCAGKLAQELARDLVVLHVDTAFFAVPDPLGEGVAFAPLPPRRLADVETWVRERGLDATECVLLEGSVLDTVITHARQLDAPVVVCGSRRLSLSERLFASSNATDLARWADRAVLIVPQDGPPAAP